MHKIVFWGFLCFFLPGVLFSWLLPSKSLGPLFLNFGLIQVWVFASTILHELGHAAAGQLAGFKIFAIEIGKGRVFREVSLFGFRWQFRSIPVGGFAHGGTKSVRSFRLRQSCFVLGGPLANGILFTIALFALSYDEQITGVFDGVTPAKMLLLANTVLLVYALVPHLSETSYGKLPNDGLLLWKTWTRSRSEIEQAPYAFYLRECAAQRSRGNIAEAKRLAIEVLASRPGDINFQNVLAFCDCDEGRFSDARDIYRSILEKHGDNPDVRALMLNNIAFVDVVSGNSELLSEADEASRLALAHSPLSVYYRGTRGCVLVELGQYQEGIELLQQVMSAHTENFALALDACFIALAAIRSRDFRLAEANLALAQKLDPKCWMLERTKGTIQTISDQ